MSNKTKIKIKIKDGESVAHLAGRPTNIVNELASLLVESPGLLFYFNAAVRVAELQINKQSKK